MAALVANDNGRVTGNAGYLDRIMDEPFEAGPGPRQGPRAQHTVRSAGRAAPATHIAAFRTACNQLACVSAATPGSQR